MFSPGVRLLLLLDLLRNECSHIQHIRRTNTLTGMAKDIEILEKTQHRATQWANGLKNKESYMLRNIASSDLRQKTTQCVRI